MSTLLSDELDEGLRAGENLVATVAFDDYPASDGYTCRYDFRGPSVFYVEASVSSDSYVLALGYADTADLLPGQYIYVGYVTLTSTSVRTEADSGVLNILANPATKTQARVILDALEALIEGRATQDQRTTAIGDVQLQFMAAADLMKWRNYWRAEVASETASALQAEGAATSVVLARFTNPV